MLSSSIFAQQIETIKSLCPKCVIYYLAMIIKDQTNNFTLDSAASIL